MIETLHEIAKQETQGSIAVSLNRIANALECLAFPYMAMKKDYEEHCKKEKSWKEQAEFYAEANSRKNQELQKLNKDVLENE